MTIILPLYSAILVLSHRSAGKSSWRRAVSREEGHGVYLGFFPPSAALGERCINTVVPRRLSYYLLCRDYMIHQFSLTTVFLFKFV